MEIYSHPDIAEILSIEGNNYCCDCHAPKPKWSSINNGIFLCLKCAGVHRSFGLNISVIRSLQIDEWDSKQLLYLSRGGNANFLRNLREFNIDEKADFERKYRTRASQYYRDTLKEKVEKLSNPNYIEKEVQRPSIEEGNELLDKGQNDTEVDNNKVISNYNVVESNQNNESNSFFGFMNSVFGAVKGAADKVSQKMDEIGITEKVRTAGNIIHAKTQEVYNSEVFQGIKKNVEDGINTVVDKGKELLGVQSGSVVGTNENNNNANNDNNANNASNVNNNNENPSKYGNINSNALNTGNISEISNNDSGNNNNNNLNNNSVSINQANNNNGEISKEEQVPQGENNNNNVNVSENPSVVKPEDVNINLPKEEQKKE